MSDRSRDDEVQRIARLVETDSDDIVVYDSDGDPIESVEIEEVVERFDDLDPSHRPKSGNADFSVRWQREDQGRPFIDSTVERWRSQFRAEAAPLNK